MLREINDINTSTKEGQLLSIAIELIASDYDKEATPYEVLESLNILKDEKTKEIRMLQILQKPTIVELNSFVQKMLEYGAKKDLCSTVKNEQEYAQKAKDLYLVHMQEQIARHLCDIILRPNFKQAIESSLGSTAEAILVATKVKMDTGRAAGHIVNEIMKNLA